MKKNLFICIIIAFIFCSCGTQKVMKVTVHGTPGTTIYNSHNQYIATIDNTGQTTVELTYDKNNILLYEAFWQAKSPSSDKLVPFGLDYTDCNRSGKAIDMNVAGVVLCSFGGVTTFVGTLFSGIGGGNDSGDLLKTGIGMLVPGAVLLGTGATLVSIGGKSMRDPDFTYKSDISTNEDIIR